MTKEKIIGVVGAGSFGTALALVLSRNSKVLMYSRNQGVVQSIKEQNLNLNIHLPPNILATNSLEEICTTCNLIIPVVPSSSFRNLMREMKSFLRPSHILIHGTKGLDIQEQEQLELSTISEVILQETNVLRVGCISGPNLSEEMINGLPAAAIVASHFNEVVEKGIEVFQTENFDVFGSKDLLGAELAGALKNIVAIGSGAIHALEWGKNAQSYFITRSWHELLFLTNKILKSKPQALLGLAGIGDLIATATSTKSRNYQFGFKKVLNQKMDKHHDDEDLVEGIKTVEVLKRYCDKRNIHSNLINSIYSYVHENEDADVVLTKFLKSKINFDEAYF